MFLVEPASGQRCQYPSAQALGAAIRRGELGPQALIFHKTRNRWLPITVHPEYRKVETELGPENVQRLRSRFRTPLWGATREGDAQAPSAPPGPEPPRMPFLIPGDGEPSWLGSAFRHLMHLARSGM